MDSYVHYNANPFSNLVGDCTVRAISAVLDQDWEQTYVDLCLKGFLMRDMPSANRVWGSYLRDKGFRRDILPDECPDCYTVRDFCEDHPTGKYILAIQGHVVAVLDGKLYDSWNSGNETPIYYWQRKE